ncbi:MAG: RIP metalloprotease RseP [Alphaproteobacteria bacterium]
MFDYILGTVIPFLFVLTVLVFVHELGHYLVARWNGVRVEVFSIGFGPELFGWTARSGTRWRFSALPLGGYVKMLGGEQSLTANREDPPTPEMIAHLEAIGMSQADYYRSAFPTKRLGQRAAIVAAGPVANFLLSAVVFAGLAMFVGEPTTEPVAGEIVAGSAAERAGLEAGDRIVEVDGSGIGSFEELIRAVQLNVGTPMELTVERAGETLSIEVMPDMVEETDPLGDTRQVARLGISQSTAPAETLDPFSAVVHGFARTWEFSVITVRAVGQIVAGSRGTEDISGIPRIMEMSGHVAASGTPSLAFFIAALSISLGLINLLPIPVLDGGHLLFYAIEAIRGRPLGRRAIELAMGFGLVVIIGLFLTTTVHDLMRYDGIVEFFNDLTG